LQATNQPTTNQLTIAESTDQLATNTTAAKLSAKSAAKSAAELIAKSFANSTKSYAQIAVQDSQKSQD